MRGVALDDNPIMYSTCLEFSAANVAFGMPRSSTTPQVPLCTLAMQELEHQLNQARAAIAAEAGRLERHVAATQEDAQQRSNEAAERLQKVSCVHAAINLSSYHLLLRACSSVGCGREPAFQVCRGSGMQK